MYLIIMDLKKIIEIAIFDLENNHNHKLTTREIQKALITLYPENKDIIIKCTNFLVEWIGLNDKKKPVAFNNIKKYILEHKNWKKNYRIQEKVIIYMCPLI